MDIAAWNIVLTALIAVLVTFYGIWLRYVIKQQLQSKDTAIQALEAVIKSKEAEISSLKSESAPAIAKAYSTMRQHANQMAEESQRLSEALKRARATIHTIPATKLLYESGGLLVAVRILEKHLGHVSR